MSIATTDPAARTLAAEALRLAAEALEQHRKRDALAHARDAARYIARSDS